MYLVGYSLIRLGDFDDVLNFAENYLEDIAGRPPA